MTSNHITLLHLSLIPGISPATLYMLLNYIDSACGGDMQELYKLSVAQLQKIGCHEKVARAVYNGLRDISALDREVSLLQKHDIHIVMLHDDEYPKLLKTIHVPPVILYVQGRLAPMPYVAFVGSRQANIYGQSVVDTFIPEIIHAGVTVVSGGAYGIDSMVHQAVVDGGGVTIAVLGTGLLNLYPQKNKKLFESIVATGGALISPFSLDTSPEPWRFPVRNRIIAGMSSGTVVVQAAQKSGALITAAYALQEGRAVCAVPGSLYDSLSAGCHDLLQQGACLVQSGQDVLREVGIIVETGILGRGQSSVISEQSEQQKIVQEDQQSSVLQPRANALIDNKPILGRIDLYFKKSVQAQQRDVLVEHVPQIAEQTDQEKLRGYCKKATSTAVLSLKMGICESAVQSMLFELQLDGKVEQDFAGLWQAV